MARTLTPDEKELMADVCIEAFSDAIQDCCDLIVIQSGADRSALLAEIDGLARARERMYAKFGW